MHCVVLVEKELSPYIQVSYTRNMVGVWPDYIVGVACLYCGCGSLQVYLSHPVWSSRITVLIGSPMRRADLARARIDTATACFIHTSRSGQDPETAVRRGGREGGKGEGKERERGYVGEEREGERGCLRGGGGYWKGE